MGRGLNGVIIAMVYLEPAVVVFRSLDLHGSFPIEAALNLDVQHRVPSQISCCVVVHVDWETTDF